MLVTYLIIVGGLGYLIKLIEDSTNYDSDSDLDDFSFFFKDESDSESESEFSYDSSNKITFAKVNQINYFYKHDNKDELWYSQDELNKFIENLINEKEKILKSRQILLNSKI